MKTKCPREEISSLREILYTIPLFSKHLKWIAFISFHFISFQNWYFAKAGEALTKRLRKESFLAFLRQVSASTIFEIPVTNNILYSRLCVNDFDGVYIFCFSPSIRTLLIMTNLIMEQAQFVRDLHPRFPPSKGYVVRGIIPSRVTLVFFALYYRSREL